MNTRNEVYEEKLEEFREKIIEDFKEKIIAQAKESLQAKREAEVKISFVNFTNFLKRRTTESKEKLKSRSKKIVWKPVLINSKTICSDQSNR